MNEAVRLNKYLAHTTGMSRREADEAISDGRVLVNNKTARLGAIVQPSRDSISINNQDVVARPKHYTYLLLNKPVGYVCSRKQQGDAPTIYELLPRQYHHLKVAGRLDKDSCGLVLLTDDGDAIYNLTHPKFAKQKIYHVGLNKPLKAADKRMINDGIELEDGTSKLEVEKLKSKKPNMFKVTMHEGRNRQIRRTFRALGYTVTHLERQQLGGLVITDIKSGEYTRTVI